MLSIKDKEENDIIGKKKFEKNIWIGLIKRAGKSKFTWTDGTDLKYQNFKDNDPSKSHDMPVDKCVKQDSRFESRFEWIIEPW